MCKYCQSKIPESDYCSDICKNRHALMKSFKWRCALNPIHNAVVIHEIIPRSLRPKNWWELDNMVPLCHNCHDKIHREGTRKYRAKLQEIVNNAIS